MVTRHSHKGNSLVLLAHLGTLITVSAWGTSFLASKILMEDGGFTPAECYVYRFVLAYLILLLFSFKNIRCKSWRDELTLAISGICSGSLYFVTENYALLHTTTGNVSLLSSISPIFTTLLLAALYKQRIKAPVIIGSVIAFIGVGCVIFSSGGSLEIRPTGDILALAAALSWAIYSVVIKRVLPLYNGMFITRKQFFYGVITAIPLLMIQKEPYHIGLLFDMQQPQYLLNLLFLVLICSITAYLIWNQSMKVLGPVTANNYIYMQPLVTMIAGYFVLGENITLLGYLGCALIIGGLVISDKLKLSH